MQKQIKITYLKKATKFLKKNTNIITEEDIDTLIILAIKKKVFDIDTNIDIKNLKGNLKGKYKIRKGDIRIIIDIQKKVEKMLDEMKLKTESKQILVAIMDIKTSNIIKWLIGLLISNGFIIFQKNIHCLEDFYII